MSNRETFDNNSQQLEKGFGSDTAAQGYSSKAPGAGQCAAVATIVYELLGGELVSVRTKEGSHWFNRIEYADMTLDVDLTGDQFDLDPVLIGKPATIYSGSRTRNFDELNAETLLRAKLLAERAGLNDVADRISVALKQIESGTASKGL